LFDAHGPLAVNVDGVTLTFDEGEPLSMQRVGGGSWTKGSPFVVNGQPVKRGRVTGAIRDVFHEPLTFVYASGEERRANERVAQAFANRPGIPTSYPVMSDDEFIAKQEPLANDRALFLVGRTNKVLAALSNARTTPFPIQIESGAVTVGKERFTGKE